MSAVPEWLKSLRLHKYTGLVDNILFPNVKKLSFPDDEPGRQHFVSKCEKSCLFQMMSLSYEEMLDLTEEKLEKMGVTKVRYCLAKKYSHQFIFHK